MEHIMCEVSEGSVVVKYCLKFEKESAQGFKSIYQISGDMVDYFLGTVDRFMQINLPKEVVPSQDDYEFAVQPCDGGIVFSLRQAYPELKGKSVVKVQEFVNRAIEISKHITPETTEECVSELNALVGLVSQDNSDQN